LATLPGMWTLLTLTAIPSTAPGTSRGSSAPSRKAGRSPIKTLTSCAFGGSTQISSGGSEPAETLRPFLISAVGAGWAGTGIVPGNGKTLLPAPG